MHWAVQEFKSLHRPFAHADVTNVMTSATVPGSDKRAYDTTANLHLKQVENGATKKKKKLMAMVPSKHFLGFDKNQFFRI
jgi:hypothetical protein